MSSEWNGHGLPPVGACCEFQGYQGDLLKWKKGRVVGLDDGIVVVNYKGNYLGLKPSEIQPIKDQEQIAAEEREMAAKDMATLMTGHENHQGAWGCYVILGKILYDAGYRKVTP